MTDKSKKLAAEAIGSCLSTRLRLAARVITKVYDAALRPFGLTASQMSLLAVAASCEILRQADVSTLLQMDNSTLSRNLDRMRANGWLEKVASDDARVHSHRLTDSGKALFERVIPAWRLAQRRAQKLLGESGVKALHRFANEHGLTV